MMPSGRDFGRVNVLYAILAWGLFIVSLLIGLVAVLFQLFGGSFSMAPYGAAYNAVMVVAEALPIAVPGIIVLLTRRGRPMIATMRLRFKPSALLAVPTALGGYLFVIGLTSVWSALLYSMGLGPEQGADIPANGQQLLSSILIIAIWPALCEEFMFRGLMLPAYERHFKSPVAAIALTGLFFGLMHGQLSGAPGHIFLGIVMAMLVYMTDSIWTGVLYHLTNNACAMILSYFVTRVQGALDLPGFDAAEISGGMMAASGALYIAVGGALLAIFISIYFAIYSRNKHRKEMETPQQEVSAGPLSRKDAFMPWLPLIIAAPIVVLRYILSLVSMIMSGAGLL